MLTPRFSLTQTDDFVEFRLECRYVKVGCIHAQSDAFVCRLIEDGRERSSYDIDSGIMFLSIPKETPKMHFPDLDLLTKLMESRSNATQPPTVGSATPATAVMAGSSTQPISKAPLIQEYIPDDQSFNMNTVGEQGDGVDDDTADGEQEFDWNYPQQLPDPASAISGALYGFNNQYSGFGANIHQIASDVLDIVDLDHSTPESRRAHRILCEDLKFDDDYYITDLLNDDEIQRLIKYKPESWKALKRIQTHAEAIQQQQQSNEILTADPYLEFNAKEQDQLRQLSNRRFLVKDLIDPPMEQALFLGLVDIMFGYCYNVRTTEGEDTVESPWTLCKLSGTLSAFDIFSSLSDVVVCCLRRSLAYPLYRNFALSQRVMEDVVVMLKLGRRAILKALLHTKRLLERDEITFVLDRIWITDYCVWIQHASDRRLRSLASQLHHFQISRELTGWPLGELEELAREDVEDGGNGENTDMVE
eukprot:jgi/Hompol1/6246/HPOL_002240-RA